MAAEIQNLEFNIDAKATGAKSVGTLARNIERLQRVCASFNTSNVERIKTAISSFNELSKVNISPNISKQISNISESLSKMGRLETSKLDKLADTLKKFESGGTISSTIGKQLKEIGDSVHGIDNDTIDKVDKLGNALSGLKEISGVTFSSTIAKQIGELADSVDKIDDAKIGKIKELGEAFKGFQGLGNINFSGLRSAANQNIAPDNAQTDIPGFDPSGDGMAQAGMGATSFGERVSNVVASVKEKLESLSPTFAKIKSGFDKIANAAGKIGGVVGKVMAPFNSASSKVLGLASSFGKLGSSIGRIMMYRAIRTLFSSITQAIKEGVQNLYQYSSAVGTTFKSAMDTISTSANYAKNSLGAMAGPIISSLAPAIDYLIDKFVTLVNVINMFFSAFSGVGFTVAKKVSTGFGDVGKSAGGASGKVKELKKTILGFDEINKLNDQPNSGGGGGGGGGAGGLVTEMFESAKISDQMQKFVDEIKAAFKEARWEDLGKILGNGLNSIVDMVPWGDIGNKLGYWMEATITVLDETITTFDFFKLGGKLADLVNGAIDNMLAIVSNNKNNGFWHLGHLIGEWFLAIPGMVIGFVQKLDWGNVATAISDTIIGYFNSFTDWLKGVDWGNFGKNLIKSIVDFIKGIKFTDVAKAILEAIWEGIKALGGLLGGAFGEIGDLLGSKFNSQLNDSLKQTSNNDNIKANASLAVDVILTKEKWKDVTTWVKQYIGGPLEKAVSLAKDKWSTVKSWVENNIGGAVSKGIGLIQSGWSNVADWIKSLFGGSVDKPVGLSKNGWSTVASWVSNFAGGAVSKAVSLVTNGWTTVKAWVDGLKGGANSQGVTLARNNWSTIAQWAKDSGFVGKVTLPVDLGYNSGVVRRELGGIYSNGRWSAIQQFASGGAPNHGSMFVAGENGPEIVGHVGRRTEVLNKSQIGTAIYTAMVNAMASANPKSSDEAMLLQLYNATNRQNELLLQQNELLRELNDKDTTVEITTSSIQQGMNRKNVRDGKSTFVMGV